MTKNDALWVAAAVSVSGLASLLLASQPILVAGLIAAGLALWWLSRLDWWQRFYAATLLLMMGAVSTVAPLMAVAEYGRYAAAGALLGVTWLTTRKTLPVIRTRLHSRVLGMLWIVVLIAALSILWSVDKTQSALQTVALAILVGLIHLLSTRRWTDRAKMVEDFRVAFDVLTLQFFACLAAWALHLPNAYAFGGTADTAGRFQGVFNNPNMLALLAAISIPLGIGLFNERRTLWRLAIIVVPCSVLILTESRTSQIAAAIAIIWMVLRSGAVNIAKFAYVSILGFLILLASGIDLLGTTFSRFGSLEGGDLLNTRGDAWGSAIELVQIQPLGYGWQAGRELFESLQGSADFTFTRTSVHNSYLQFILELGIMGILPLAYLTFALLWTAVAGKTRGLESGFVGVITAGLIVQITESAIFGTGQPYPYVFWFAMAGALTVYRQAARRESKRRPYNNLPAHYRRLARRQLDREPAKST